MARWLLFPVAEYGAAAAESSMGGSGVAPAMAGHAGFSIVIPNCFLLICYVSARMSLVLMIHCQVYLYVKTYTVTLKYNNRRQIFGFFINACRGNKIAYSVGNFLHLIKE
jgi:hypothetical protein